MAINRYDTPAQYNPINTYVPIPFQEMMQVVDYRKKEGALGDAMALELAGTEMGEVLKSVRDPQTGIIHDVSMQTGATAAEQEMSAIKKGIGDLTSSSLDYSDPKAKQQLNYWGKRLNSALSPNGVIGFATSNKKEYDKQMEVIKANKDANTSDNSYLTNDISNDIMRVVGSNAPTKFQGNIGTGNYVDETKYIDDAAQGFAFQTTKNYAEQGFKQDPKTNLWMTQDGQVAEVSADRLKAYADDVLATGALANQLNEREKGYFNVAMRRKDNRLSEEDAREEAKTKIATYKQNLKDQIVGKYTLLNKQYGVNVIPGQMDGNGLNGGMPSIYNVTTDLTGITKNAYNKEDVIPKYDEQGNAAEGLKIVKNGKTYYRQPLGFGEAVDRVADYGDRILTGEESTFNSKRGFGHSTPRYKWVELSTEDASKYETEHAGELNKENDYLTKIYSDFQRQNDTELYTVNGKTKKPSELTKKEVLDLYSDAYKNFANVSVDHDMLGPDMIDVKTKQLVTDNSLQSLTDARKVVIIGTGKNQGKRMSGREAQSIIGTPKSIEIKGRTRFNPYGMPGAYVAQVLSKDGETHNILIDSSVEEQSSMVDLGVISQAMYTGQTSSTIKLPSSGKEIEIVNLPTGNSQNPFKTSVRFWNRDTGTTEMVSMREFTDALYKLAQYNLTPYAFTQNMTTGDVSKAFGFLKNK